MSYRRVYRLFGFSTIGLVDLIVSVLLSRSLGLFGLLLPSLLIATAYLCVYAILDLLIFALELRSTGNHRGD